MSVINSNQSITLKQLFGKTKEVALEATDAVIETIRETKYAPLNGAKLLNLGIAKTIATTTGKSITREQYYNTSNHFWEEVTPLWEDEKEEEKVQPQKKEEELPDLDKLSDDQIMMIVLKNKERLQKLFGEKTE